MPLPREGKILDYSRWQQNLIGLLHTVITYDENILLEQHTMLTIDTRLAYRNKGDKDNDWKHYASSLEQRELDCTGENVIHSYLLISSVAIFVNFDSYFTLSFSIFPHPPCNYSYLTNTHIRVDRFHCSNWAHCITIFIC